MSIQIEKKVDSENDAELDDASNTKTTSYTNEQRIVAAVWMHEKLYNHQSVEDIKNNFKIRFKLPPPNTKTLVMWENKLFSQGKINPEDCTIDSENDNSEDQFSDVQTSDEENSD